MVALLLAAWVPGGCAGSVRRNVTVTGVSYERALAFPVGWVSAVRAQSVQNATGECPPGRYCRKGTSEPVKCAAGYYSSAVGLVEPCVLKCFAGYYCPDPGKLVACPANTHSGLGGYSQLDCKCDAGFQCVYRRQINLNVGLNVPYRAWLGPAGEALRAAVLQAVAESAGVPVGSVRIEQVLPSLRPVAGGAGAAGGNRRLLERRREGAALLRLSVVGAEKVEGLRERLARRPEFRGGAAVAARVHWSRADKFSVTRAPETSQWLRRIF